MRGGHAGFQQRPISDTNLQDAYLAHLAGQEIPKAEITQEEFQEKEAFRLALEKICHEASITEYAADLASIKLVMFGSLASGFATQGSDMDLAIVPEWKDASQPHNARIDRDIPRLLERAILEARLGGRLLTRTRVPILKVCQSPTDELYKALFDEREKWDALSEEEKYPPPITPDATPHDHPEPDKLDPLKMNDAQDFPTLQEAKAAGTTPRLAPASIVKPTATSPDPIPSEPPKQPSEDTTTTTTTTNDPTTTSPPDAPTKEKPPRSRAPRKWLRERKQGPLDFPKSGVGIQCDINFSNPLALHNTHLLRCYSLADPRVRPMVLFVKAWAKRRMINSAYSGTLSSYGWVLMVLHYLVNIAAPAVCPNLMQQPAGWRGDGVRAGDSRDGMLAEEEEVAGYAVRFWRDAGAISSAASKGLLTRNTQSVAELLRGFFHYYASIPSVNAYGQKQWTFFWATEVLSLRTSGGIRRKEEKGWTRATTTLVDGKEVRQRYLFSIEDPFEVDHNVARTVTHDGIVAIRDELRRAGRILGAVGRGERPEGGLFDEVVEQGKDEEEEGGEDVVAVGEAGEKNVVDGRQD